MIAGRRPQAEDGRGTLVQMPRSSKCCADLDAALVQMLR
jgi:hypothetical protein